MRGSLARIQAIVKADFLIRFRRASTAVIFVGLCISAYLWIPDPASGKALIQMQERRALYNSAAIAMATSTLCTLLLGLIGFYMISNSIKRDIQTRTGFIIASTTVKNWEYILGKFFGNAVFISAIMGGFMVSSMVMQLYRGEAPLQPLVFFKHYLLVAPPCIVFLSAVAIFFESTRFLSGKFGDIAFFFLWLMTVALVAGAKKDARPNWTSYLDTTGMAFMMRQVQSVTHTDSLAIGSSTYDTKLPPFVFEGFHVTADEILPRTGSLLYPLLYLLPALLFFHRFNPAKLKTSGPKSHHSWLARINGWLRPLTRRLLAPLQPSTASGHSFWKSILSDALLTFQLNPAAVFLALGFSILAILKPASAVLPAVFAVLSVVLSDIATREGSSGTTGIVYGSPFLKQRFVMWKWASTAITILAFVSIPLLRMLFSNPAAALSLVIGIALVAAAATSFGSMTTNPKTFVVVALLYLYLVVNDGGHTPMFDVGGWYQTATAGVKVAYALTAVALIAAAELQYRWKLQRA